MPPAPLTRTLAPLVQTLGTDGWVRDATLLAGLKPYAEDAAFRVKWRAVKQERKAALAAHVQATTGYELTTDAMYDIQVRVPDVCVLCVGWLGVSRAWGWRCAGEGARPANSPARALHPPPAPPHCPALPPLPRARRSSASTSTSASS